MKDRNAEAGCPIGVNIKGKLVLKRPELAIKSQYLAMRVKRSKLDASKSLVFRTT